MRERDAAHAGAPAEAAALVAFWREAGPDRWFEKDAAFDEACRRRWLALHDRAAAGELAGWLGSPIGALALVLLLDQIPRNVFRGTARVWATDPAARSVAEAATALGFDRAVEPELRQFFYLPFVHAEDLAAQDRGIDHHERAEDPDPEALRWARHHRDIVARFGRFPHRNAALGRESTEAELAYLAADGFKG